MSRHLRVAAYKLLNFTQVLGEDSSNTFVNHSVLLQQRQTFARHKGASRTSPFKDDDASKVFIDAANHPPQERRIGFHNARGRGDRPECGDSLEKRGYIAADAGAIRGWLREFETQKCVQGHPSLSFRAAASENSVIFSIYIRNSNPNVTRYLIKYSDLGIFGETGVAEDRRQRE
ncbi:MAG: hypothetical protein NTAFB05_19770 [Nitrobacter sp.]